MEALLDSEASKNESTILPKSLAWIERGSAFIRRMNSERIAEDPHLKRLFGISTSTCNANLNNAINEPQVLFPPPTEETHQIEEEKPLVLLAAEQETAIVTEEEEYENKPTAKEIADSTYKLVMWTYKLHASLQSSLQYALFAKASEDGLFIPLSPRVYCVAPAQINVFQRLFTANTTVNSRSWNTASKRLHHLDDVIARQFQGGACVFDCGLFDGINRLYQKPLVYDEFCDGKITSLPYCRSAMPSIHSLFIVVSTVSSWLELASHHVSILMAPTNEQMSVFATCCAMYEASSTSSYTHEVPDASSFGMKLLEVYDQHIKGSESWPSKLTRTFSQVDMKNTTYFGTIPRPQARIVSDFQQLLTYRNDQLTKCKEQLGEKVKKLNGIAVIPANQALYIHQIVLLTCSRSFNEQQNTSITDQKDPNDYRPYFVLQNEKGNLFSSMVHGVRNVNLSEGPHIFRVGKNFNCGDFILKMYHLPFGRKGELIFDVRLHSGILFQALEHREVSASPRSHRHSQGEITLCLSQGDFDCISSTRILPQDFAVQILFGRDPNDFPQNIEVVPRTSGTSLAMGDLANSVDEARQSVDDQVENSQQMHLPPAVSLSARTIRSEEHTSDTHKRVLIRYLGPKAVSFNMDPSSFSSSVRTAFGDAKLFRVDLIRKETSQEIGLFLLFHVHLVSSFDSKIWKVLPYKFLFRYVVPFEIRMKMIEMEAEENLMNTSLPLSFGDGQGMSFDEEYARWLQQMYDTEMMTEISEFDGGFCANNLVVTKIQPSDTYKSLAFPKPNRILHGQTAAVQHQQEHQQEQRRGMNEEEEKEEEEMEEDDPNRNRNVPVHIRTRGSTPLGGKARGASTSLINQLPVYIYTKSSEDTKKTVSFDCLVCRSLFEEGETIKCLPCFHSYHAECIDSWLFLNKVCPVCQYHIDQAM